MATLPYINIVNWNSNGLRNKIAELIHFSNQRNAHVIAITETLLTPDLRLRIPGFKIFRSDASHPKRGVLLAIRSDITAYQRALSDTGHLEAVAATISTPTGPITIACVYNSPSRFRPLTQRHVTSILDMDSRVILTGDLNARNVEWGCRSDNENGRKLLNLCLQRGLKIIYPNQPTRYPTNPRYYPSILDLTIIKGMSHIDASAVSWDELNSDHNPVAVRLRKSVSYKAHQKWDLQKADWKQFRLHICSSIDIPHIQTNTDIDTAVESLTKAITFAANSSIPKKNLLFKGDPLPIEIKALIEEKNRVRRIWHRFRTNKTELNSLVNKVRQAVAIWRQDIWINRIKSLNSKDTSIWQFARQLRRGKVAFGPLEGANGLEYLPERQADILADNYEHQFTNNEQSKITSQMLIDQAAEELEKRGVETFTPTIRPSHVREAIKLLKQRKAPGYDGILPTFVKFLPGKAILLLARILQSMLRLGYFPTAWKKGEIVPIHKPGKDPTQAISYRPICLLPVLGKLAERLILKWLEKEVHDKKLLPDTQFGFRRAHSAVHQIVRVTHFIKDRLRLKKATAMILLDVAKAFDSVHHLGLAVKLLLFGLPEPLCQIIAEFLRERVFRVRVGDARSKWCPIRAGVPQGALLSPILYALYVSDMPRLEYVHIAQYADDTCIYYSNKNFKCLVRRVQEETQKVLDYLRDWKLKVNPTKSEAILFTKKRKYLHTTVNIDGHRHGWKNKVRYLGAILDRRGNWAAHLQYANKKARQAVRAIWPLIRPGSALPIKEKINLYQMLVKPCITYAAPAWFSYASRSNLLTLKRIQSKTLRVIAQPPPGTNNEIIEVGLGVEPLMENLEKISTRFKFKCANHENPLIIDIYRT